MGFSRQTFAIREYIILFYRERDWGLDSFHSPETIVQLTNLYWRCTGYCTVRWTGKTEESSSQVFFFLFFPDFLSLFLCHAVLSTLFFNLLGPSPSAQDSGIFPETLITLIIDQFLCLRTTLKRWSSLKPRDIEFAWFLW